MKKVLHQWLTKIMGAGVEFKVCALCGRTPDEVGPSPRCRVGAKWLRE